MGERVFKRGLIWYAWVPKPGGGVEKRSTLCTDKKAALIVAAKLERAAVDPEHRAQDEAETEGLLVDYLASRQRLGRADGTLHHVRVKAAHLKRLLPARAAEITHSVVSETFVDVRLEEGARRTTIKKELRVLKAALRLGAKNGRFKADPDNVIPELEDDYEPRTRFLEPLELVGLCLALGEDRRAAMVAFIVATGARLGEARRARREDIIDRDGAVFVKMRGTKTKKSKAEVPIVGPSVSILSWAVERGARSGPMFPIFDESSAQRRADKAPTIWGNVVRDLEAACKRAGIAKVSPNDLRRTMATWLERAGAGTDLVWRAMRHVDGRMVERVYGQMAPADLGRLLEKRTAIAELPGPIPPLARQEETAVGTFEAVIHGDPNLSDESRAALLQITRAAYQRLARRPLGAGMLMGGDSTKTGPSEAVVETADVDDPRGFLVPRDGIEPPTRGFSSRQSKTRRAPKKIAQDGPRGASEPPRWATNGRSISSGVAAYLLSEWAPLAESPGSDPGGVAS